MEAQRPFANGSSPARRDAPFFASSIGKTSLLVVAGCLFVLGLQYVEGTRAQYVHTAAQPAAAAAASAPAPDLSSLGGSTDTNTPADLSMVGPSVVGTLAAQYQTMKQNGTYTPEAADAAAQQLAAQIKVPVSYKQYTESDIHTSSDTSYNAMLDYRTKLKEALTPLTSVKDLELAVFGKYAETKDPAYLEQLRAIVANYTQATQAAAALTVPDDAASLHVGILNAMGQFGGVLSALADNANDPITVMTLLRNYNDAESTMISSFNDLATYFAHHPKP